MRRDILFLTKNLPFQYLLRGEDFFMVRADSPFFQGVTKLAETITELKPFITGLNGDTLIVCGFKNDFEVESDAIDSAWQKLGMFLDAYPFITEEVRPAVSSVLLIHEESSPDVLPRIFMDEGWARWKPEGISLSDASSRRIEIISDYLPRYFSYISSKDPELQSGLLEQMQLSLKMFRSGTNARSSAIEFLCKFFGLEALVCGDSFDNRTAKLKSRLTALCGKVLPDAATIVKELHKRRCSAAHGAQTNQAVLLGLLDTVDRMMLAVFVFAVDHLDKAKSVDELWSHVSHYNLPEAVFAPMSGGQVRIAFTRCVANPHLTWRNVGKLIGPQYYSNELSASNPDAPN